MTHQNGSMAQKIHISSLNVSGVNTQTPRPTKRKELRGETANMSHPFLSPLNASHEVNCNWISIYVIQQSKIWERKYAVVHHFPNKDTLSLGFGLELFAPI
jgi:hypothetical protein